MSAHDPKLLQKMIDQLTVLVLLIERMHVASLQNMVDAKNALRATETAVDLLEQMQPSDGGPA